MAHLLPILFTLVRHHIDDQYPSIRLEGAVSLCKSSRRDRHIREDERDDREVERLVLDRKLLELAGTNIYVGDGLEPFACGLEHLWR